VWTLQEHSLETTSYSLDSAMPSSERRDGKRHLTLFRVGAMTINGRRELCLIKNISAGGMKIRPYCELLTGSNLIIELKTGMAVDGRVAWIEGGDAGVEFVQAIDVIDVLSKSPCGPRQRMPRIEIDCVAMVRDGAKINRMRVVDVSQGGIKLESAVGVDRGTDLVVTLPGMTPQPGVARWCEDGYIGVTFNRLLSLAELVDGLKAMREELRAA
jgi:hypothetical protein